MLLCKISSCITRRPPENNKDALVIYPINENKASYHPSSGELARGNIHIAGLAIDSLYKKGISPTDDVASLPLLNLYIQAFEFLFKFLIEKLNEHRDAKCCQFVS